MTVSLEMSRRMSTTERGKGKQEYLLYAWRTNLKGRQWRGKLKNVQR